MIELSREIRFSLVPPPAEGSLSNSWCGWPSSNLVAPYLILKCSMRGTPDSKTGYVCNIKEIDDLLRQIVTKKLIPDYRPDQTAEEIVRTVYREAKAAWESLAAEIVSINLALNPYLNYTIQSENSKMIRLTQQFEFSASHRLHCSEFSDEENRKLFGKCNNPNGHGHNYVVEITLRDEIDSDKGTVVSLHEFEATVKRLVVDRLDHQNLNVDVDYFADVIPSVENIAIAIWNWLDGEIGGASLDNVRVYETPKTWADYRG